MNTKVNKSSADCAKFNEANKESIEIGLFHAEEPTDYILMNEKVQAERLAKNQAVGVGVINFVRAVEKVLPVDIQVMYDFDAFVKYITEKGFSYSESVNYHIGHCAHVCSISIEHFDSSYYRVVIGGYGDSKRVKIGQTMQVATDAMIAKVVDAVKARVQQSREKEVIQKMQSNHAKVKAGIWNANETLFKELGLYSDYKMRYDEKTGKVNAEIGASLTVEQWTHVRDLLATFKK